MPVAPKLVVVVPTYNEKDNLRHLVAQLESLPTPNLHVLVVDDNSPDGTGVVADELAERSPGTIRVLHRAQKEGLGRAYVDGMTFALDDGADIVIQMDADLSHPVTAIPVMVDALADGAVDVVIGSRYVPGGSTAADWPVARKLISRFANRYVNVILRLGIRDATAGFKAWRADALRKIDITGMRSIGYSFQVEANYAARRHGLTVTEVPIHFVERSDGASKMSLRVQLQSAVDPWRMRWSGDHGPPGRLRRTLSGSAPLGLLVFLVAAASRR